MTGTARRSQVAKHIRWTPRHHRLVELAVLGLTNNEIAAKLNYSYVRVSQLLNHPDIAQAVEQLRAVTRDRSLGSLQDDLAKDARETFDKLRIHRNAEDPDVSLRACGMLWDRQIPKRVESKSEQVVRFVIEAKDLAYLKQVAAEDDLEADYTFVEEHDDPSSSSQTASDLPR